MSPLPDLSSLSHDVCTAARSVAHLVNPDGHIFFLPYLSRPPPLSAPLPQETSSPTSRFLYRRPNWWCTAAVAALKPARSCVPIVTRIPYATSTPDTSRFVCGRRCMGEKMPELRSGV
uniref:Uncharacterized protein n=1 Tax=Triticum urartu TaxID=4572 RepID=A0A8R7Q7A4_TRIUA